MLVKNLFVFQPFGSERCWCGIVSWNTRIQRTNYGISCWNV